MLHIHNNTYNRLELLALRLFMILLTWDLCQVKEASCISGFIPHSNKLVDIGDGYKRQSNSDEVLYSPSLANMWVRSHDCLIDALCATSQERLHWLSNNPGVAPFAWYISNIWPDDEYCYDLCVIHSVMPLCDDLIQIAGHCAQLKWLPTL